MKSKSHAKINCHLAIGPKRKDGYHSLKTTFQEISLHDTLTLTSHPKNITLFIKGNRLLRGPNNLIVKALLLLRKKLGVKSGARVTLIKKIPIGAGLGGGSSNAATALKLGWRLWGKGPLPKWMNKLAASLGADVPFFLKGGRAKASGIGEKLKKIPSGKKKWLVLVYPKIHISTKTAYQLLDRQKKKPHLKAPYNSFEAVIFKKEPRIKRVKEALEALGCTGVMMSGSGSAVFGYVNGKAQGKRIARKLKRKPWDVFLVHTIVGAGLRARPQS